MTLSSRAQSACHAGSSAVRRRNLQLMRGRGMDLYLSGAITAENFANNLAREWASLPVVSGTKKGRSFYDGDGLNKAHVDIEPFLAAVRAVKTDQPDASDAIIASASDEPTRDAPASAPPVLRLLASIIAAIRKIFGEK